MIRHTIYFVRHGQTEWNVERRLQGSRDTPLTELGREHARENAKTLREAVPELLRLPFVASPLGRARATMEIIREHVGLPRDGYAIDKRLAEMTFGEWEGLTLREIQSKFPTAWAERQASKWAYVPTGGESYSNVAQRLEAWLGDLSGDAVVVAHGAVGRILRGLNLGLAKEEIAFSGDPEHDRVYRLANGTEAAL